MKSNFDSPLYLFPLRQKLEVSGPLGWESGDPANVRLSVRITQNESVNGRAVFSRASGQSKWKFEFDVDDKLHEGQAEAWGQFEEDGGPWKGKPWTKTVVLVVA